MGAPFSVRAFFLHVCNDLLRRYFERRGELLDFPWDTFVLGVSDPLYEAWGALPADARAESEGEFRAVFEVASPEGIRHLLERGRAFGLDVGDEIARRDGLAHKAFWAFLEHREVFDAAREFCHVEHLHGRYWRVRRGLPQREPDVSNAGRIALGKAISAYYWCREHRGEHCDVHWHVRDGRHYFVAYPEDHARSILGWEGGVLQPRIQRPAFEVVFAFDAARGHLELNARGDKHLHADMQQIFGRALLGEELPREIASAKPVFLLNRLKRRDLGFPTDPAFGIREVRVKQLGLSFLGGGGCTMKAPPPSTRRTLYDDMDDWIREDKLPLTNVDIDAATMELHFARDGGRRQLTFSMKPNWSSLRDDPDHLVARECLRMWEIACA